MLGVVILLLGICCAGIGIIFYFIDLQDKEEFEWKQRQLPPFSKNKKSKS